MQIQEWMFNLVHVGVGWKIGDGRFTRFWKDCWVGEMPLCDQFLQLFLVSNQKEAKAKDMWYEEEGGGC